MSRLLSEKGPDTFVFFSAQYDGNTDVYTIPATGGSPTRLTTHPGPDMVRGFTPDGKAVLFSSARHAFTNRYAQLFTVPLAGDVNLSNPTNARINDGEAVGTIQNDARGGTDAHGMRKAVRA